MDNIIERLGNNHTDAIVFESIEGGTPIGVYTFNGKIFCIHSGIDFPFEELDDTIKKSIIEDFKKGNYILNPSFQG
jgi:hypothetical protein